jgi:dihydroorotate dehydrogenase electron transfer subunit
MISCSTSAVIGNERLRDGFYLLKLEAPAIAEGCMPGQFVMLKGHVADWPYLRRPFSVYSSDGESCIDLVYKVIGRATGIMSRMQGGDSFDVIGPLGNAFAVKEGMPHAIAVAGGIGIPPVGFFCQKYVGVFDQMILIVGAAVGAELLVPVGLVVEGVELVIYTEDGSKGSKGTACDGLQRTLGKLGADRESVQVVACGPKGMLYEVHRICKERGITCEVSVEEIMACGVGACLACAVPEAGGGYLQACRQGPVLDSASIDWERWLRR